MTLQTIKTLLDKSIASRVTLVDTRHEQAFRLFNGFTEGNPNLVIDIYARTLLIHNYAAEPDQNETLIHETAEYIRTALPWLSSGLVKKREGRTQAEKCGLILFGDKPDRRIKEHGIWYAIDLTLNRDASFYLDTRNLRKWLIENMQFKTVLNTFAYTGSLGVAALAGGASRVVQIDRNRRFLNLAKDSYSLNGFPIRKRDFISADFFPAVAKFKSTGQLFDCVIIDPPLFSSTSKGKVNQAGESARLINKVRPLISNGGTLIAINNALYLSGQEYMQTLTALCQDGYLKVRELIAVPEDSTGYEKDSYPIANPAPFNHSTKIALLDVKRK